MKTILHQMQHFDSTTLLSLQPNTPKAPELFVAHEDSLEPAQELSPFLGLHKPPAPALSSKISSVQG